MQLNRQAIYKANEKKKKKSYTIKNHGTTRNIGIAMRNITKFY